MQFTVIILAADLELCIFHDLSFHEGILKILNSKPYRDNTAVQTVVWKESISSSFWVSLYKRFSFLFPCRIRARVNQQNHLQNSGSFFTRTHRKRRGVFLSII